MYNFDAGIPSLLNCLVNNNKADAGAAMYNAANSPVILRNCTIDSNAAIGGNGGLVNINSNPQLENTILFNNGVSIADIAGSATAADFCNIQLPGGAWPGGTNINCLPAYVDPDGDDNIPGTVDDDHLGGWLRWA